MNLMNLPMMMHPDMMPVDPQGHVEALDLVCRVFYIFFDGLLQDLIDFVLGVTTDPF